MLISKKGLYYLKVLLFFEFSNKRSFSISEISERVGVNSKVLEQILLTLKNLGVLQSKRGPRGGYRLKGEIKGLSVKEVLDMTGQRIEVFSLDRQKAGMNPVDEILRELSDSLDHAVCSRLEECTIGVLADAMNEKIGKEQLNYII